jgi:hypothetical protein
LFILSRKFCSPVTISALRARHVVVFLLLAFGLLSCSRALAEVGVILNDSLDTSVARITGSGHSAVYFSRVCPESPTKLRLCRNGEPGSVISNYTTLGEDQPYEWNVVPLSIYLYGVENPRYRPMFGSEEIKRVLEERYREKYLSAYCTSESCRTSDKAEWREMVGATLSRNIYIFTIATTIDQDRDFIDKFNAVSNENHFNGVTRNCANFTQRIINTYFPRATGADYVNDFGMTSPKAVARSFTRYARHHPDARFRVYHFAQLPGTIKRSTPARTGTEQLYRSKKLLVPMLLFADHELPFFAASYVLFGRFDPEHEMDQHPAMVGTAAEHGADPGVSAEAGADPDLAKNPERARVLGTSQEWKNYRAEFDSVVKEAARDEIISDPGRLTRVFKQLNTPGSVRADNNGSLWIDLPETAGGFTVGLSADNLLAPESDSRLTYELILARAQSFLKSPKHSRETMVEFKKDWAVLQDAREKNTASVRTSPALAATSGGAGDGAR